MAPIPYRNAAGAIALPSNMVVLSRTNTSSEQNYRTRTGAVAYHEPQLPRLRRSAHFSRFSSKSLQATSVRTTYPNSSRMSCMTRSYRASRGHQSILITLSRTNRFIRSVKGHVGGRRSSRSGGDCSITW